MSTELRYGLIMISKGFRNSPHADHDRPLLKEAISPALLENDAGNWGCFAGGSGNWFRNLRENLSSRTLGDCLLMMGADVCSFCLCFQPALQ